ncbi:MULTISPECIES: GGDEF domain-containing protein [Vibrio]|uniref:diguanylate cyclase n=2 Tax=Vibrio TaxID=662 RepID=A0A7X4LK37_9VIBR|nr:MULTISPECIES: GGDEF domain-containing protein [Vibrio]MBF9002625.1 GGDEF domain-containing protein [Vibrio nitrifigilis]MZI93389.1 diguanylate cyclase [Vibrio eleionomae]
MYSAFITSHWFRLGFPLFLLSLIWLSMNSVVAATQANLSFAMNMPYILLAVAFMIAHTFKQSRIVMLSTAMMIGYWVIQERLQSPLQTGTTFIELCLLAFLLPVSCWLTQLFHNGTTFNRQFVIFLLLIGALVGWSCLVVTEDIHMGMIHSVKEVLFVYPNLSKLPFILILYISALIGISALFVLTRNHLNDVVIYATMLVIANTFYVFDTPFVSSTMFSLLGVLFIIYLLSNTYQMAFTDPLTQIPGRQALEIDLRHLSRRYTLAMIDVDHFKKFNDTYGHSSGDDVLKLVATRLCLIRGNAHVYRYGGEEFVVLFRGKHMTQTLEYLEEIRLDIADYPLVIRDTLTRPTRHQDGETKRSDKAHQHVNITVSIGVCDNQWGDTVQDVQKLADEALYRAKDKGRNQIFPYQTSR